MQMPLLTYYVVRAMRSLVIIGAGKVGTALAALLKRKGYRVQGIASRSLSSAQAATDYLGGGVPVSTSPWELTPEADLVFVTTPDDAIAQVAEEVASREGFRPGQVVAHTSGALPSSILEPAKAQGAWIGSLHPLQSFADPRMAEEVLPRSTFCLEGDPEAVKALGKVVEAIGGEAFTIPTAKKPLYHAAAVLASNFFVTLLYASGGLYEAMGLDWSTAWRTLRPLVEGTFRNVDALGPVRALTGPVARGDVGVVRDHLEALRALPETYLDLYRGVCRMTVEVALKKGTLSPEAAEEILRLLEG